MSSWVFVIFFFNSMQQTSTTLYWHFGPAWRWCERISRWHQVVSFHIVTQKSLTCSRLILRAVGVFACWFVLVLKPPTMMRILYVYSLVELSGPNLDMVRILFFISAASASLCWNDSGDSSCEGYWSKGCCSESCQGPCKFLLFCKDFHL